MALLPTIKSIRQEDLGVDLPEWIENLLSPLSTFMESIYSALNKNITFTENIACKIIEYEYITSSTYLTGDFPLIKFNSGLNKNAIGCIVLQAKNLSNTYSPILSGVSPAWLDLSSEITINYISGLSNNTKYKFTFLII